jgi:hypothetical protein
VTGALAQPLAVVFALGGASSYAVGSVAQQQAASRLQTGAAVDPALLLRLATKRRWLLALVFVLGGFTLQAAALDVGRLVVVEPVFPAGLLLALVLAARAEGRRLRRAEWTAAVAAVAGLAVFLVAAEPSGGHATAPFSMLSIAAAAAVMVALVACVAATKVTAAHRALVLSIGGGICAGVTDALIKSVASVATSHRLAVLADPRLWLLAVVGLTTFTVQQNAFRAAGLAASLPAFAVLEPVVGTMMGLFIYHERVGVGPARIAIEVLAAVAALWGIAQLAKSVILVTARLAAVTIPPADPAA